MGRDIRGTLPSLASVHVDEVRSHYRSLLCRAAVVAGVAGDADPAAVREALATGLGDLRDGAVREPPPDPEARAPGRRLLLVDKPERSQVHYAIGQVGVPASHPDWVALRIAETAFGGTFTSVLMQEIREKRGWSYGVYSGEPRSRLPDVYQMVAYPSAEDAPACLALNLELFEAHCRGELDDEAIEAARSYLLGRAPFLVDTYEKRLDRNLEVDLLGLHPEFWTTYPDKVAATSAEDVRDALRRHRRPDDLSVVVVCTAEGMPERLEAAGLEFDEVQQIPYDHAGFGLEGPPSA